MHISWYQKLIYNLGIALDALTQNKVRSLLTSLGIIFGVGSVIAMLAIGRGAQQEILAQMTILGANNIIIEPIIEQEESELEAEVAEGEELLANRFTPGLSIADVEAIAQLPFVEEVSPEIILETSALRKGRKRSVKLIGVSDAYFHDPGLSVQEGSHFQPDQMELGKQVCIIGYGIKSRFFPTEEALGKQLKVGKHWLTVVGIMGPRNISSESRDQLGIRNYDMDVYTPCQTVLMRYVNRQLVTQTMIRRAQRDDDEAEGAPPPNYHQIDRLVVRVSSTEYIRVLAEIVNRMLARRHNEVVDFEIIIPELLLKQKQQTTDMFKFVLSAIASISLLVGGIGIMNIMLASVMERLREIGLRLAIGATKSDIILQFMSEAVVLSLSGGIVGILIGVGFSLAIESFADIETIITPMSILLSFTFAVLVGLIFGMYPATKAAKQDPVVSLRSN
ncbi:ABC transporter permease [Pontibacter sp. G13]|uniref:ABC transporter permease n=1 Tax=Pontibacter sp. G13 TaxID=3074898 RepID=UPI002889132B|nr:ABC transporter permease [Pontibacter sp. G13]WNJ17450.1 ABC transporter permease [Pontibacter sp. G13]